MLSSSLWARSCSNSTEQPPGTRPVLGLCFLSFKAKSLFNSRKTLWVPKTVRLFCAVPLLVSFLLGVQKTQQVPYCSGHQALNLEHVPLSMKDTATLSTPSPPASPQAPGPTIILTLPESSSPCLVSHFGGVKGMSTFPHRGGLKHLCRRLLIFKILLNVDY